ncbi:shikimate dehydrogenase [Actinomyces bowdenii]|uniref:shikimate dehydrogenase n=1 Tax=Actinomyces bowdenii TaxID=131109 RepID=UPI001ABCA4EE|nr:shikimate dehydrogenase [Actinomyces bowdenii]MBO3724942.1 shikimate dehydrogenase [Actinomyces bowdenii]
MHQAAAVRSSGAAGEPGAGPGSGARAQGPRGWRAAVIGAPVAHSLSPALHRAAYADLGLEHWSYEAIEVAPPRLPALLDELAAPVGPGPGRAIWAGLSVTMPHKQSLLALLDAIDPLARTVGAVNTVVAQRAGEGPALLAGFNTDVAGIVEAIRETRRDAVPPGLHEGGPRGALEVLPQAGPQAAGGGALVLGSGATACSALAALTELGAGPIAVAARRHAGPGRALSAAHRMGIEIEALAWTPGDEASDAAIARRAAQSRIVVSTLPAGAADTLAPHLAPRLSPARGEGGAAPGAGGPVLLDVAYDPWPSALAAAWQAAGGLVAPGWLMLLHQAVAQVRLMTGRAPRVAPMRAALARALEAR